MKWLLMLLIVVLTFAASGILTGGVDIGRREWLLRTVIGGLILTVLGLVAWNVQQWQSRPVVKTPPTAYIEIVPPGQPVLTGDFVVDLLMRGRCFRFSVSHPDRQDARQCINEHGMTFDPCFPARDTYPPPQQFPGYTTFICLLSPWHTRNDEGRTVFRTNGVWAKRPWLVGIPPGRGNDRPWALELANGQRCIRPLRRDLIPNPSLTYACFRDIVTSVLPPLPPQDPETWLIGFPNRTDPVWTVRYFDPDEPTAGSRLVEVRRAWR